MGEGEFMRNILNILGLLFLPIGLLIIAAMLIWAQVKYFMGVGK